MSDRPPIPEATLAETPHGREPEGDAWFVVNVADTIGYDTPGSGIYQLFDNRAHPFRDFGIGVHVLWPGQPTARYHEEGAQEGFLVLHGTCTLVVEEQERTLRQWDYFHCPGGTRHITVGAGDGPCAILMIGARPAENPILYPVSEAAARYGASVDTPTTVPAEAYAGWPATERTRSPWPLEPA